MGWLFSGLGNVWTGRLGDGLVEGLLGWLDSSLVGWVYGLKDWLEFLGLVGGMAELDSWLGSVWAERLGWLGDIE